MVQALLLAADASKPPTYSKLPRGTKVVLGYVGLAGCTPHVWSVAEAQTARRHGFTWAPIVTVAESGLNAGDGREAAAHMIAVLPGYRHPHGSPVFLDVEHAAILDNPDGSRACIDAWTAGMHAGGYPRAYAYADPSVGGTWLPDWVKDRPKSLPSALAGWQYEGSGKHPEYDLSVFRADLWSAAPVAHTPTGKPASTRTVYTVVRGDDLVHIGRRFGVPWQSVYAWNRQVIGDNPDVIKPGMKLTINPTSPGRTYTVRRNDNLSQIAAKFHTSWQSIYAANKALIGSDPDYIVPGQVLTVP